MAWSGQTVLAVAGRRLSEGLGRTLADCLKVMTLWVNDEGCKVVWTVVLAKAWGPVVQASCSQSCGMKLGNRLAGLCGECNVESGYGDWCIRWHLLECQLVATACWTVADGLPLFSRPEVTPNPHIPKRLQGCVVEGCCALDVRDTERNVVKHVIHGFRLVSAGRSRDVVFVRPNVRAKPTVEADAGWPRKDHIFFGREWPDGGRRSGSAP
jgi:hypothetical protein